MNKIPIWMDCDTGTDDAVAIMTAHALEELEIIGLSTVCGNAPQEFTYTNTLRMNRLMGTDYPVYRGAETPLLKKLETAETFHGKNGLGDVQLPLPENPEYREERAWDAMYETAKAYKGELKLIATGPLTNVAIALAKYPDLPEYIPEILIMGGSAAYGGNVTPAAEFNIYVDPEAAAAVFKSGMHVVMCGLDVTMQGYFTPEDLEELEAGGTAGGRFTKACLGKAMEALTRFGLPGVAMHDSCPVVYLAHPEFFKAEEAGVYVETRGSITNGKTVTDLYSDKQFEKKNATVVLKLDRNKFIGLLKKSVSKIK